MCSRTWAAAALIVMAACAAHAEGSWSERLRADLQRIETDHRTSIGVHVRDLSSGAVLSHRGDETWYFASMVKLPVAIAVMRGVEQHRWSLDTLLELREDDLVDGAGFTLHHAVGTRLSVRYLMEQMLIHSDNTASDVLIRLVGIDQVNAVTRALVPDGFGRITGLGDVRRLVYRALAPAGVPLRGRELLALAQLRSDAERLQRYSVIVGTPVRGFRLHSLRDAYEAYYESGLNSGRLDAFGELLALLVDGDALGPAGTAFLLDTLERTQTGMRRIKAGLPPTVRFAHKTGTQRARICDAGIVYDGASGRRIVVAACVRGEPSRARAERALKAVGEALAASGLLAPGTP
jgi:beta-lactamase class A